MHDCSGRSMPARPDYTGEGGTANHDLGIWGVTDSGYSLVITSTSIRDQHSSGDFVLIMPVDKWDKNAA